MPVNQVSKSRWNSKNLWVEAMEESEADIQPCYDCEEGKSRIIILL